MKKNINLLSYLYPVLSVIFILAIWAISAKVIDQEIVLPTFGQTWQGLIKIVSDSKFFIRVANSVLRCLIAFLISFILASSCAILSKIFNPVKKMLHVVVLLLKAVPTMSFILLALIWMSSFNAPILVAVIVLYPIMYSAILTSIESVDSSLIEMANAYKVPKTKQIKRLYLPQIQNDLFKIVRANISFSIKLIIAAEVMAYTKNSIGVSMNNSRLYFEMGELFAWTLVAIIIAGLLELIVIAVEKIVTVLQTKEVK